MDVPIVIYSFTFWYFAVCSPVVGKYMFFNAFLLLFSLYWLISQKKNCISLYVFLYTYKLITNLLIFIYHLKQKIDVMVELFYYL
jgi:hypothetical protein